MVKAPPRVPRNRAIPRAIFKNPTSERVLRNDLTGFPSPFVRLASHRWTMPPKLAPWHRLYPYFTNSHQFIVDRTIRPSLVPWHEKAPGFWPAGPAAGDQKSLAFWPRGVPIPHWLIHPKGSSVGDEGGAPNAFTDLEMSQWNRCGNTYMCTPLRELGRSSAAAETCGTTPKRQ